VNGAGTLVVAQSSSGVEQMVEQIRQIDSRITALQSELSALESQSDQSSRDSVAIVSASAAQLIQIQSKMAQVDNLIASKKNEIAQVKSQRQNLGRDSLQKVTAYNSERSLLSDRVRQTELSSTGAQNELNVLTQRMTQLQQFSQQQSDPSQVSIQKEKSRYDSIAVAKQEMLNAMHLQLKQMESDSGAQAVSIQSVQLKNEQEFQQVTGELAAADGRVQSAKGALDQAKARLAEKKGAVNATVQQLISRKASLASQLTQSSGSIKGYEAELSRLRANAGAVQKKYEAGRAPIAAQLNEATTTLATREQQQKVWMVIRDKFTLDSTISATRNQLDELIQQAASGKRGAKKLIDPKETELNALLGKQDGYLHEPGVKQMEAQLASLTMSQKRARIEQVLSNIANDISKQTTLKMQAQQALAQYDTNNPLSSDPSLKRMRQLDTLLAAEQAKKAALNSVIDSSDLQIKLCRDSITAIGAAANNEIAV
jgi:chromosome segregation ATPase